jgi:hypothetical protein
MSRIRLYFDEDAMQNALIVALRARRIDIPTVADCEMSAEATKIICATLPTTGVYCIASASEISLCSTNVGPLPAADTSASFSDFSSATPWANN